MKNNFLKSAALSLFSLLLPPVKSQTCVYFTPLGEDSIFVQGYMKDTASALREIKKFGQDVRYVQAPGCPENNPCQLNNAPLKVRPEALKGLFEKIKTLPADIRGVEIKLGLEGNHVVFIFQLITMHYKRLLGNERQYRCASVFPASVYVPGSESFLEITGAECDALTDAFAENIRIRHKDSDGTFSPLITEDKDSISWRRDTRSIIFSFQEIFAMTNANFNCQEWKNEYLYFYSAVAEYRHTRYKPWWTLRNKQTVLISCEPIPSAEYRYTISANYAHLCPPSCNPYYLIR